MREGVKQLVRLFVCQFVSPVEIAHQIAHMCYAISRLPAQFQDSKNVQHNLEIAQILRLRRTYIHTPLIVRVVWK